MVNTPKFIRDLIKGRVAENIFEQMIREAGGYTVIPFGYEHTAPMLAQLDYEYPEVASVKNDLKNAPDFLLITNDKSSALLVEVKYRHEIVAEEIWGLAESISNRWETAWLLVATHNAFFFKRCTDIVADKTMGTMSFENVPEAIQKKYHDLLMEFVRGVSKEPDEVAIIGE